MLRNSYMWVRFMPMGVANVQALTKENCYRDEPGNRQTRLDICKEKVFMDWADVSISVSRDVSIVK